MAEKRVRLPLQSPRSGESTDIMVDALMMLLIMANPETM